MCRNIPPIPILEIFVSYLSLQTVSNADFRSTKQEYKYEALDFLVPI